VELPTIKGAGYFHDLRYNGNINVSMAGGSIIKFSAGSGLDDNPVANRVVLRNHDIFTTWIDIVGHLMDDQDEFRSETMLRQEISFTMPDLNTLMQAYPMLTEDWFNQFDAMSMYAEIMSGDNKLTCGTTNDCRIVPHWSYTPIWYGLSPAVVYPG
jgi:hypothetical protein